jgi:hypothetical protein
LSGAGASTATATSRIAGPPNYGLAGFGATTASRNAAPTQDQRYDAAEAQRIAARAASASTAAVPGPIFRSSRDWLAAQLGRPPVVGDLDADVIAAHGRHLKLAARP